MNATEKDTTYNGWTNYETWNWALWLDNEQGTDEHWREQAREAYRDAKDGVSGYAKMTGKEIFTRMERAANALRNMLKADAEENNPLTDAGPYSDLLGAALSEINWQEISEHYVEDVATEIDEYEKADEDAAE